jgi:hypothetical protein
VPLCSMNDGMPITRMLSARYRKVNWTKKERDKCQTRKLKTFIWGQNSG